MVKVPEVVEVEAKWMASMQEVGRGRGAPMQVTHVVAV